MINATATFRVQIGTSDSKPSVDIRVQIHVDLAENLADAIELMTTRLMKYIKSDIDSFGVATAQRNRTMAQDKLVVVVVYRTSTKTQPCLVNVRPMFARPHAKVVRTW